MVTINNNFLPQDGQYHDLIIYKKSECICDLTYYFCERFLDKYKDRTVDQMVQAARSGKQNIVEGSAASATSKETEIKLMNVAKASHQELLEDYKDYLVHHGQPIWQKGEPRYEKLLKACHRHNDREYYMHDIEKRSDEAIANICITLICQEDKMLRNYIERLKQRFLETGGIKEEMSRGRMAYRREHPQSYQYPGNEEEFARRCDRLVQREQALENRERAIAEREKRLVIKEEEIARLMRMAGRE
ncbi:MAG: four helix bundle protein, partial [Prevotella sp.]|nr:four helix bundle protein [Prevotella sp.]